MAADTISCGNPEHPPAATPCGCLTPSGLSSQAHDESDQNQNDQKEDEASPSTWLVVLSAHRINAFALRGSRGSSPRATLIAYSQA